MHLDTHQQAPAELAETDAMRAITQARYGKMCIRDSTHPRSTAMRRPRDRS